MLLSRLKEMEEKVNYSGWEDGFIWEEHPQIYPRGDVCWAFRQRRSRTKN